MSDALDVVFRPRAVAIIGASHDTTKRGFQAVSALLESGYQGHIQPVNPRGGELLGLPVTTSIAELDPVPDLALVCTPAATIPQVLEDCARRGIAAAVVLALGFGETGEAGAQLERQVRDIARRAGIRVVGPNTSGILNLPIGLNLIGARGARAGSIGLLTQSGNVALNLLNETATGRHEGISICVGMGNQVDLGVADYLRYLDHDENTRAIALYVEGLANGRDFFDAARDPARSKPIVLLKGGRSIAGQSAARSHTGALTGEYAVVRAALRQAGVIEVQRTDELFPVAETLAQQPPLQGGIAVLSDGGGHATLAADTLSDLPAPLAVLSAQTEAQLRALLGPNASTRNPVDLAGSSDAAPRVFAQALELLLDDASVGGVLVVGLLGGYALRFSPSLAEEELDTAQQMARSAADAGKTLVVHSMYAPHESAPLDALRQARVPVVESLEIACRCIAAAAQSARFAQRRPLPPCPPAAASSVLADARAQKRSALLETEARQLLEEHGLRVVPARLCRTESDVLAALRHFKKSLALKVVAPGIAHKTDVGGVRLDVAHAAPAAEAFRDLMGLAEDTVGVLAAPMLPRPLAEALIGARCDPQFGPILTVGLGGTLVELQPEVSIRLLPIDAEEAVLMLHESALQPFLLGLRGAPPIDQNALVDGMLSVASALLANPELSDLEVNPLFVYQEGVVAVDARAFLK